MRIAYVAIHLGQNIISGGVGYKIQSQLRLWQAFGHEVRLFLHTPDVLELPFTETFRYGANAGRGVPGKLRLEGERSRVLAQLIAAVKVYQPDCIYFRYGLYTPPLQNLFRIAPVAVEINTNDVFEYTLRGPVFAAANRLTRRITLGQAAGLVPASHEIAQYPENTAFRKPTQVIANGIDLDQIQPLPAPSNPSPRLAFVGSPGYSWHGVDKLPELARRCSDLDIDIIGCGKDDFNTQIPTNLHLHGFLSREQVRPVLARADVAFGSLALHRKNMREASPLKVRESLGFGIPTILAYEDTDLSGSGLEFLLQLPNTEGNVHDCAEQIRAFAYAMQGRRADRATLHPLIDQRVKEERRLAFFTSLLS